MTQCKRRAEKKQNNKPLLLSKWWLNYFRFFSFIFPDQWTIESGSCPIQNIAIIIIIIDIDIIKMSPCSVETTINKDKKQTNIIIKCIGIIFFCWLFIIAKKTKETKKKIHFVQCSQHFKANKYHFCPFQIWLHCITKTEKNVFYTRTHILNIIKRQYCYYESISHEFNWLFYSYYQYNVDKSYLWNFFLL